MTSDKSGPVRTASPDLDEDLDDTRVRKDVPRPQASEPTPEPQESDTAAPESSDGASAPAEPATVEGASSKGGSAPAAKAPADSKPASPGKPAAPAPSAPAAPASPGKPAAPTAAKGAASPPPAPPEPGSAVPTTGGVWRAAYDAGRTDVSTATPSGASSTPASAQSAAAASPQNASAEPAGTTSWNRVQAPDAPPAPPAPAEGTDGVRSGAMKAAQAALDAARSAARKVSSIGTDETPATPSNAADATNPRPEMHYTAAGVRGTATPAPAAAGTTAGPRPASVPTPQVPPPAPAGPRRVRLAISRVDPWSVMKLAFLLAVAVAIMTVVATAVFWSVLDGFGVFTTVQGFVEDAVGPQSNVNLTQFVEFPRVISLATLISICNIVLLTAIATIMAFLYNITAALVGGVHLTLTDD